MEDITEKLFLMELKLSKAMVRTTAKLGYKAYEKTGAKYLVDSLIDFTLKTPTRNVKGYASDLIMYNAKRLLTSGETKPFKDYHKDKKIGRRLQALTKEETVQVIDQETHKKMEKLARQYNFKYKFVKMGDDENAPIGIIFNCKNEQKFKVILQAVATMDRQRLEEQNKASEQVNERVESNEKVEDPLEKDRDLDGVKDKFDADMDDNTVQDLKDLDTREKKIRKPIKERESLLENLEKKKIIVKNRVKMPKIGNKSRLESLSR